MPTKKHIDIKTIKVGDRVDIALKGVVVAENDGSLRIALRVTTINNVSLWVWNESVVAHYPAKKPKRTK